ncbi:enoyl-CoA hydratase/isomerase family protein [Halobacteriales archaeon Cl-PHB]
MIRTATDGDLRVVTLDRPERRNALTNEGLYDLADAVLDADEPVLYLQGAGEAFCAGADLDIVADLDRNDAREFAQRGQRVATMLAEYDGATVAGVDGAARGGGVELALACDIRVATPAASFAETGVSLGLFGAWGGTARLPQIVGRGEAMDIALSGRVVEAEEAKAMGLVSRVVEDPITVAEEIAANDPAAVRVLAERMRDTAPREVKEDREAQAFARLIESFEREESS